MISCMSYQRNKKLPKISKKASQPSSQDAASSFVPNCESPNLNCSTFADPNSLVSSSNETVSKRGGLILPFADVQEKKDEKKSPWMTFA